MKILVPLGELFGLRVNPDTPWINFYEEANKKIQGLKEDSPEWKAFFSYSFSAEATEQERKQLELWRKGNLKWENLSDYQKELLLRDDALADLYGFALADSHIRNSPAWKKWQDQITASRETYNSRRNELVEQVRKGKRTIESMRQELSEAGRQYGTELNLIEANPDYAGIYAYLDKRKDKGHKYDFRFDIAVGEYTGIMFADYKDEIGDFDWKARDKAISEFITKWGEDNYALIRAMFNAEKEREGVDPYVIWVGDVKDKLSREYWQLPYKPLAEMSEKDKKDDRIPEQYLELWEQYSRLIPEKKEAFLLQHPELGKDFRNEYLRVHPEADAMLAMLGYRNKVITSEAYEKVVELCTKYEIPIEALELQMPPYHLRDAFFGYEELLTKFSGGSSEAMLYRLEHPELNKWGVDDGRWTSDLSDKNILKLRLIVQYRPNQKEYDALKTTGKRAQYLKDHPDYQEALWKIYALGKDLPDRWLDDYVHYRRVDPKGNRRIAYFATHRDFYEACLECGLISSPIDFGKYGIIYRGKVYE